MSATAGASAVVPARSAPARTQRERREATIAKLLDATVAALCEAGYAGTTVQEVCTRAGVSPGGLFRHFPTRLDLIVAAAEQVRKQQLATFAAGLSELGTDTATCLRLVRTACRAPINAAWYELLGAARTDLALRERLAPMLANYHEQIAEIGRSLPLAETISPKLLETVLFTVVHLLDGEALSAVVYAHPEQEELRLQLLERMLLGGTLLAAAT